MTIAEHIVKVKAMGLRNAPQVELPDQIIRQYIEYACRRVWRNLVTAQEDRFRITATLNHGDSLPANFAVYANRAYDGNGVPFRYIPIQIIGTRKTSEYNLATPSSPDIYFENQKVYFLPDSTMMDPTQDPPAPYSNYSGVTVYYYQRPPKLYNQPDDTDDGLPAFCASFVHSAAFNRCLEHYVDRNKALLMAQERRKEDIESIGKFFNKLTSLQNIDVRTTS